MRRLRLTMAVSMTVGLCGALADCGGDDTTAAGPALDGGADLTTRVDAANDAPGTVDAHISESGSDAGSDATDAAFPDAQGDVPSDAEMDAAEASSSDAQPASDASTDSGAMDASDGSSAPPCQSLSIPAGGGAIVTGSGAALSATGDACYEAWVDMNTSKPSPATLRCVRRRVIATASSRSMGQATSRSQLRTRLQHRGGNDDDQPSG